MYKPTADNIVVELDRVVSDTVTSSGLILEEAGKQEKDIGVVIAVGPEVKEVQVGERILFTFPDKEKEDKALKKFYAIIKETGVLAVIEDSELSE